MSDDVTTITFRLPAALREKIKERARLEERSEGAFVRYHLGLILSMNESETVVTETEELNQ